MTTQGNENRLKHEKSPYLLQHARNPVNWYPWGEEAFERARREDRPVFLSIGYSTCHWCHVMARESFEDPGIAGILNRGFVSVKVDREERPDIDHFYMAVCQAMTGSGGWPLTVIMTPDREPFFAGTYIPRTRRYGMTGLDELLTRTLELWDRQRDGIATMASGVVASLRGDETDRSPVRPPPGTEGGRDPASGPPPPGMGDLHGTYRRLEASFDAREGGFGREPKFPTPHHLLFLLRYGKRTGETGARDMAELTLDRMRNGGMYDQIGYGFHRYSTDREWLVPHFEKMLYDQALLMMAYTEAYRATRNENHRRTVREMAEYVARDLTSPGGGFYSAEDADSEGEEGRFYLWTVDELRERLGPGDADMAIRLFSLRQTGNFNDPHRPHGKEKHGQGPDDQGQHRQGQPGQGKSAQGPGGHRDNIPHISRGVRDALQRDADAGGELNRSLENIRSTMLRFRGERVRPHLDDKILTDWNGLMMAALAGSYATMGGESLLKAARAAERFIMSSLRTPDGELLHRYRDGEAAIPGNLDDHAFLVWGLLELYGATFDAGYLAKARELTDTMIHRFLHRDPADPGIIRGFFFSADTDGDLPFRRKEFYDGAIPSGNAVAVMDLVRLGRLTGEPRYEEIAAGVMASAAPLFRRHPDGHVHMMNALDLALGPSREVVIVGDPEHEGTAALLGEVRDHYLPDTTVVVVPDTEKDVVPDTVKDVVPDTEKDVVPDTEKDVVPDTEKDVVPDTEKDVVPDSVAGVVQDPPGAAVSDTTVVPATGDPAHGARGTPTAGPGGVRHSISILDVAPFLAGYRMMDGRPTAYVCRGYACLRPTTDPSVLREMLGAGTF